MNEIEYNGFVARITFGSDNYLRGTVRDTHELIELEGLTLSELRSDFASKIAAYKERCAREGIQPFATYEGKSTAELDALDAEMYSGDLSKDHPAWPHRHTHFFDAKRQRILDNVYELEQVEGTEVPRHLRLQIDDKIDELRQRTRSPRLSPDLKTPEWLKELNRFVRFRLADCFRDVSKADPRNRDDARQHTLAYLTDARKLQVEADQFLTECRGSTTLSVFNRGLDPDVASARFQTALLAERELLGFLKKLSEMIGWAYDDLDDIAPAYGGRPRLNWRYDFIAGLADLWRLIADQEPSFKSDGLFAQFVEAAWQSGGKDMPRMEWKGIVHNYRRGSKSKGGKNPSSEK
jgi:predicted HicB family RNase H-like nuclease